MYKHADGRSQRHHPNSTPDGVIALASAISTMGALTCLDVRNNNLGGYHRDMGTMHEAFVPAPEGPEAIAAAIPKCT